MPSEKAPKGETLADLGAMFRKKKRKPLKEWHRTVLLVFLLAFSIGVILWLRNQYNVNFTDSF
ncbi:MAG: putative membrane protein [Candidatus Saccharimonadales bacterium]|jgi:uncharacterized membrane protein